MTSVPDIFGLVIKRMFENKSRVFLTISGIVIGIFTFVFFIFAAQGLSNAITEQFTSVGLNSLQVQAAGGSQLDGQGPPSGGGGALTDTDVARIGQVVRNVDYIAPGNFYQGRYEIGNEENVITTVSFQDEFINLIQRDLGIEIETGRFLRSSDRGSLVLGGEVAANGYENPIRVGQAVRIQDKTFRVVGIIERRGDLFIDNSIFMPFNDLQDISSQTGYTNIRVTFYEGTDLDEMKERIENQLNPRNGDPRVVVTSSQDAIDQFNEIVGVLSLIIGFISSIALLVGGINVMNTMYSNVLERINEISVMKAMGGTNLDILLLFLIESSFLGLLGALIGFFSAYGLAELLSFLITNIAGFNVPIFWSTSLFLQITIGTILAAIAFGTYPALRAAKINPADNLRDE